MLERAFLTLFLLAAGYGAFALFKRWHMRRAGRLAPTSEQPTLLYFRSNRCAPCVTQEQLLRQVERQYPDTVTFRRVQADQEVETAAQFNVFTLPTILILDTHGEVRHANYGLTQPQRLSQQLETVL